MKNYKTLSDFLYESLKIEGINREPSISEVTATEKFLEKETIIIKDIVELVNIYEPGAKLRRKIGMDVFVGSHIPPKGGPDIEKELKRILEVSVGPFHRHCLYEQLHPFTDGNGRSGRTLWLWEMGWWKKYHGLPLNFLHQFYYQSLTFYRFTNYSCK